VVLEDGVDLLGKTVIVATGVSDRRLEVTGIERFEGVGVYYSQVDADNVEAEDPVVIVGGGNSAGQAATAFAASGHPVHLLVRGHGLTETMSTYLLDRIDHDPRITVHTQTVVASVHGDRQLESVVIEERVSGKKTEVPTHYLLVMIGAEPRTAWLDDAVIRDRRGFIPTGDEIPAAALSDTTGRPSKEVRIYSRPACQVCSQSATSGPTRSSGSPPRWEKAAWPFDSPNSTLDSRRHGPTQPNRASGQTQSRDVL
jgi:thioredoxin reductase (NADPH)